VPTTLSIHKPAILTTAV